MRFGLKKKTIEAINNVLDRFPEVEEAVLYGSRAKGNYKTGSDIDLTLKGEGLTVERKWAIESEIDDLLLPYMFDISIYTQIDNDELIGHIDRVGQIFYRRDIE
jgi:predicted nucleotidyltransferase